MNLWRAPIDEKSGKSQGEPEPVTTSAPYAAHISLARTGRQLAYMQRSQTVNAYRVEFDPAREVTVGEHVPVTQGTRIALATTTSPDGEWVGLQDGTKNPGEIFVVRKDGSGLRQLTDDGFYNRRPMWSPDAKVLAFHSNRSGKFDIWTIRPDGSDLRQLTHATQAALTHPVWSPDGKRLVYSVIGGTPFVIETDKPWSSQSPQAYR